MKPLAASSLVEALPEPPAEPLAGGLVILHVEKDRHFSLNAIGAEVWQLIQQPVTVDQIVETITQSHEVDAEQCKADILKPLQAMARAQLSSVR